MQSTNSNNKEIYKYLTEAEEIVNNRHRFNLDSVSMDHSVFKDEYHDSEFTGDLKKLIGKIDTNIKQVKARNDFEDFLIDTFINTPIEYCIIKPIDHFIIKPIQLCAFKPLIFFVFRPLSKWVFTPLFNSRLGKYFVKSPKLQVAFCFSYCAAVGYFFVEKAKVYVLPEIKRILESPDELKQEAIKASKSVGIGISTSLVTFGFLMLCGKINSLYKYRNLAATKEDIVVAKRFLGIIDSYDKQRSEGDRKLTKANEEKASLENFLKKEKQTTENLKNQVSSSNTDERKLQDKISGILSAQEKNFKEQSNEMKGGFKKEIKTLEAEYKSTIDILKESKKPLQDKIKKLEEEIAANKEKQDQLTGNYKKSLLEKIEADFPNENELVKAHLLVAIREASSLESILSVLNRQKLFSPQVIKELIENDKGEQGNLNELNESLVQLQQQIEGHHIEIDNLIKLYKPQLEELTKQNKALEEKLSNQSPQAPSNNKKTTQDQLNKLESTIANLEKIIDQLSQERSFELQSKEAKYFLKNDPDFAISELEKQVEDFKVAIQGLTSKNLKLKPLDREIGAVRLELREKETEFRALKKKHEALIETTNPLLDREWLESNQRDQLEELKKTNKQLLLQIKRLKAANESEFVEKENSNELLNSLSKSLVNSESGSNDLLTSAEQESEEDLRNQFDESFQKGVESGEIDPNENKEELYEQFLKSNNNDNAA